MPSRLESDIDVPPAGILSRIAEGVAAFALGVAVGGIGTFAHQLVWNELGFPLPIGLIAGLVAVALLLTGIRIALESRLLAALAALGIVVVIGILALPGVNGSVLLPDNLGGVVWAVGPTLIGAVVLGWPRLGKLRPAAS